MSDDASPEVVAGRYELIEELGQGGMATVHRALDRTLGRDVAIKRLHPHLARLPEHRARFEREARAVASQDHPGIVKIYDFSAHDDEDAFIVMELLPGEPLSEVIERTGPLPPELAMLLVGDILSALDVAHDHQIIHRDLKPENVMVRPDASVVLMDFGIANLLDQSRITRTGALLGSPAYMAPELIDGGRPDVRSDLFAIGALLYRLVTSTDAYQGIHPGQILRAIERGDHVPAHRNTPKVGRRLSQLIDRWMSTDPDDRPHSARAASAELNALFEADRWKENLNQCIHKTESITSAKSLTDSLEDALCEAILRRAEALARSGDTLNATYEVERLLAYRPDSEEGRALLSGLSATPWHRTRGAQVSLWILAAAGVVCAGVFLAREPELETPTSKVATETEATLAAIDSQVDAPSELRPKPTPSSASQALTVETHTILRTHIREALTLASRAANASPSPAPRPTRPLQPRPALPNPTAERVAPESPEPPIAANAPAPETLKQRFRVIPAAAVLEIGGQRYSAIEAARGIELPAGPLTLRATSPGCEPLQTTIDVSPQSIEQPQRVVLHWQEGYIEVVADRDALVWVGDRDRPQTVDADGESLPFEIHFGAADQSPAEQRVELRISDRDDLTRSLKRTVTVRPGQTATLALSLADDLPQP